MLTRDKISMFFSKKKYNYDNVVMLVVNKKCAIKTRKSEVTSNKVKSQLRVPVVCILDVNKGN